MRLTSPLNQVQLWVDTNQDKKSASVYRYRPHANTLDAGPYSCLQALLKPLHLSIRIYPSHSDYIKQIKAPGKFRHLKHNRPKKRFEHFQSRMAIIFKEGKIFRSETVTSL